MKKVVLLFTLLIVSFSIYAQSIQKFNAENGCTGSIQYYDSNIIKVSYRCADFRNNENISDAVILKPTERKTSHKVAIDAGEVNIRYAGGTLRISRKANDAESKALQVTLSATEKIFGGGERALALNRRGQRLNLYNNPWYGYVEGADNLNYSVPFITSSNGYALFFDNPSKGYVDIGKADANVLEYGASSGELNVFVIFGSYEQIMASYHKLTGTQPLPPRWAFGNLMSRFGYSSEAQVKDIYHRMKQFGAPVDAIIFDLFWFGDSIQHTLGNFEWLNKSKWLNPKGMISGFKKEGVNTILVTEPFVVETAKYYNQSKPYLAVDSVGKPYYLTDFYFGHGGLIDIFRKDAQKWFWQFYKKQMDNGVEAWWGDLGEPERHPSNLYHNLKDLGYKRLFKADEVHNIYGHNWTKMLYGYYAKEYPSKRLFSLNRSGFAGSQRYSIFPWTGDVSRSWSGFRAQLPVLLGMSMSGVPYVHSDAGGFAGGEGDNELYVRWLQFAVFTPIFRPHGTALYDVDKNAFSFPSEAALIAEPYRNYAKEAIALRYRFLPYNYTLAYQQQKYGAPLIAPLYYHFPQDTNTYKAEDEYMWGANVLVAPVLQKGANSRKVYLPSGDWYRYSDLSYPHGENQLPDFPIATDNGGRWIEDTVGLTHIPVYIRGGSFIPQWEGSGNTSHYTGKELTIIYFPSIVNTSNTIFEDDGKDKNSIANKQFELISFECSGWVGGVSPTIMVKSNKGKYAGKPQSRLYHLVIPTVEAAPKSITINGVKLSEKKTAGTQGYSWNKETKRLQINFPFKGTSLNIKIKPGAALSGPLLRVR